MEGDIPLVFTCYEKIQAIVASIEVGNTPNVDAVVKSVTESVPIAQQAALVTYAKSCIQPGIDYFLSQLQSSLKVPLEAFRAARLFCPFKVHHLNQKSQM